MKKLLILALVPAALALSACTDLTTVSAGAPATSGPGAPGNDGSGGSDSGPAVTSGTTLVSLSGSGDKNSAPFQLGVKGGTISYSYDCSAFGDSGNFIVSLSDSSGMPASGGVNEMKASGSGQSAVYASPGTYHVEVLSECDWKLTLTAN